MNQLETTIHDYLAYCQSQKRLDEKTLKAYRIDLTQFKNKISISNTAHITSQTLEDYIAVLHQNYKPKTAKRKIASLKAFFHYLEYREIIENNPFRRMQIKFREPVVLPKTIPLPTMEIFLSTIYSQMITASTEYQHKTALRDAAIIELLFATGIRISELCSLHKHDVNLFEKTILIYGKGSKERKVQIGNDDVIDILKEYRKTYSNNSENSDYFFINQSGTPVSDQAIRRMIKKYSSLAAIDLHITPHMFRHTFATSLLEADVDIRYIQEILGHSSINITEIYTHVAMAKQREILTTKHPRNGFRVGDR